MMFWSSPETDPQNNCNCCQLGEQSDWRESKAIEVGVICIVECLKKNLLDNLIKSCVKSANSR